MKNSYIGFTAAAAFAALTIACGNQETQVIENFFRAVQAKDTGTLSSFAVVQFDGEVKSWKVKSVGDEQRTPAPPPPAPAGPITLDVSPEIAALLAGKV